MASNWYLEGFLSNSEQVDRLQINKLPFTIGRDPGLGFTVPSNNTSRLHAEIIREHGQLKLLDHNSTNGTFVNRIRVHPNTTLTLEHGDIVHFADIEVRLVLVSSNVDSLTNDNQLTVVGMPTLSEELTSGFREMNQLISQRLVTAAYQPIVEVQTHRFHAYEILGRGTHENLARSPGELFHKAEVFDLATELSELFRAVGVEMASRFMTSQPFFLNIHPQEYDDKGRLMEQLQELRRLYPKVKLVLELHEQVTSNISELKILRRDLNDLGIQFAYDDFGAGQTRLLEFVEVPADYLKFDIALVRDLGKATEAHKDMIKVLIEQADKAGTKTLAEGIETKEEVVACEHLGFDLIQGYYFGKPLESNIQLSILPH